jgi:hypothetical protein
MRHLVGAWKRLSKTSCRVLFVGASAAGPNWKKRLCMALSLRSWTRSILGEVHVHISVSSSVLCLVFCFVLIGLFNQAKSE